MQPSLIYIERFVGGAYVGMHQDGFAETGGVAARVALPAIPISAP